MRALLIRHGEAAPSGGGAQRPLTAHGRAEALKIAQFLKSKNLGPLRFVCSPLLRAEETAKIVAETLGFQGAPEIAEDLEPNGPYRRLVERLDTERLEGRHDTLAVVGHLPYLQDLAYELLAASRETGKLRPIRTGTAVSLVSGADGHWHPEFIQTPGDL